MGKRASHWNRIYREKSEAEMSWSQTHPGPSLELLGEASLPPGARVIDVGGGTSRLVDHLLERGFRPTVLDVSGAALERSRERLGEEAQSVEWLCACATEVPRDRRWDAWHDRATFHFLVDPEERARYLDCMACALAPGAAVVLATFGPDGPERCSGLPVRRYGAGELAAELGEGFALERSLLRAHRTPWGAEQQFLYARFRFQAHARPGSSEPAPQQQSPSGPQNGSPASSVRS